MRQFYVIRSILTALLLMSYLTIFSQDEIILNPAELIPHEDGYYIAGVEVDENEDGIMEFHNGCDDYYEDDVSDGIYDPHLNHAECGTQQNFTYVNCMIMPTCDSKSTPIEPPVATGYIQMHACLNSNTDSAIYSYIQSPPMQNLTSIYLETSADVSINENRHIPYIIEYSKDYGTTWEPAYIQDDVAAQGGYRITYDGSVHPEIQEMIDASAETPIVIRIITNDRSVPSPEQGQFVKLHLWKLTADISNAVEGFNDQPVLMYRISDRTITSVRYPMQVYNLSGKLVGTGEQVTVTHAGIYLLRFNNGHGQKVLIK